MPKTKKTNNWLTKLEDCVIITMGCWTINSKKGGILKIMKRRGCISRIILISFVCFFLSFLLLLNSAVVSSSVLEITGIIKSDSVSDFSSIVVKIASVQEKQCIFDDGSELTYYEDYNCNIIPVNRNGAFRSSTSTDYYSVAIDLQSLPDGYGADRTYYFANRLTIPHYF